MVFKPVGPVRPSARPDKTRLVSLETVGEADDLVGAASSSLAFWNNSFDDVDWNSPLLDELEVV